ncbi:50S ribosomal protein L4 [Candidatus Berkelbacteria bacterium RIFCSPHIGHO2_12_FULL_36_9]|uniref:Large ribosomal subunit protein uL4 n=1 Tax=Candidatus Berkelbacteria bacterium RIFCSPHIGHO2_12_FULL_36_9 TaxID=1797469 RepID=A0A1F5EDL9_9BACT|nr:MAG: 50S ribosomal protein L4 [Candidatus Berkelbacteria bacterium RIFCSPHIGHO2_12_FULL_36_9]
MIKTDLYKMSGDKDGQIELPKEIFAAKNNTDLLTQAVYIYLSNHRSGNAHTKIRSEVRGGGRKPWKQKGTGNARAGSTRSPIWIGGGITFGPRNVKNWQKRLSKKMRKLAIFNALSLKLSEKKLLVLNQISLKNIKTKEAVNFLEKMPIESGSVLLALSKKNPTLELSFRNLPYAKTISADSLNVYDILKYDWLIVDKDGLNKIEQTYLKKNVSNVSDVSKMSPLDFSSSNVHEKSRGRKVSTDIKNKTEMKTSSKKQQTVKKAKDKVKE